MLEKFEFYKQLLHVINSNGGKGFYTEGKSDYLLTKEEFHMLEKSNLFNPKFTIGKIPFSRGIDLLLSAEYVVKESKECVKKSAKKQALEVMYLSCEYLFEGIHLLKYGNYAIIVSQYCGGVYRVNLKRYVIIIAGRKIILQKKSKPWEARVVYEDGEFYVTSGNWLMESRQLSGGGYKCFTIPNHYGTGDIIIRDHQLQMLLKDSENTFLTLGNIAREYCINHIDGNKWNNRSENLEIVTHGGNARHYNERLREYPLIISRNGELFINPKFLKE